MENHPHHIPPRRYQYHSCTTLAHLRRHRRNYTCRELAAQLGLRLGQVQELCKSYGIRKYEDPPAPP